MSTDYIDGPSITLPAGTYQLSNGTYRLGQAWIDSLAHGIYDARLGDRLRNNARLPRLWRVRIGRLAFSITLYPKRPS